jgi:transcriptional regulator with XRE-family HTH domain
MKTTSCRSLDAAPPVRASPVKGGGRILSFGERLAVLRKSSGFTQTELARELGVSRRMIAYYEGEAEYPPTAILPRLAQTLGVTTDELLDSANARIRRPKPADVRLQRAFQQVEQLGAKERRQAMRLLNSFIKRQNLVRNV